MFQMFQSKSKEVKGVVQEGMTLEQVRVAMLQLLAEESTHHHRLGQLFNYVVERKLAEGAGYKDAPDYFSQNVRDLSPATLATYGAVARNFTEEIARRFGVTCLYLLLIYKELAGLEVNHDEPGGAVIEAMGKNGEVTPKSFGACTVDEMRKAIQRKRKPTSSKPLPAEDLVLVDQLSQAVTSRFVKGDPVQVHVRNHLGKAVLDFKGIPLAKVAKLAEALLAPPPAVGGVKGEKASPSA